MAGLLSLISVGMRIIAGLLATVWGLNVLYTLWGGGGIVAGLLFLPFTMTLVPAWAALVHGYWAELLIPWALFIGGGLLESAAEKFDLAADDQI